MSYFNVTSWSPFDIDKIHSTLYNSQFKWYWHGIWFRLLACSCMQMMNFNNVCVWNKTEATFLQNSDNTNCKNSSLSIPFRGILFTHKENSKQRILCYIVLIPSLLVISKITEKKSPHILVDKHYFLCHVYKKYPLIYKQSWQRKKNNKQINTITYIQIFTQ